MKSINAPSRAGVTAWLLAPIALSLFVGCGNNDSVSDEVDETVGELSLRDTWEKGCHDTGLDVFGLDSKIIHYEFGGELTKTTTLYAEDNCTNPLVEIKETGSYDVGDQVRADVFNIDLTFDKVVVTPLNEAGKDALNTADACDINDWAVGTGRDVTAQTSNSPVARCWLKTPRTLFDIMQNKDDRLMFGAESAGHDKTSVETRPVELETDVVFNRK